MDLFSRIATQQLGQATALKPVLPPRFAARPEAEGPWGERAVDAVATPGVHAAREAGEGPHARTPARSPPALRPGAEAAAMHPEAGTPKPTAAQAPGTAVPPLGAMRHPAAAPAPPLQHGAEPPLRAQAQARNRSAGAEDTDLPAPRAAVPRAAPLQPALPRAAAAPLRAGHATAAPLSPVRVQVLSPQPAAAPVAAPPVVHVHIDRIEVRAPAAAPAHPAPVRPARTAAQHTLADYLRGGGHKS